MQIEHVDPVAAAEEASLVLREAWPPPALHYTADYLRWQLGFPGPAPRAVLARDGGEPAGFIGVAPRRFRFRGVASDGYVLSFVSVRPRFRGQGLARRLYAELLGGLRASGLPIAVFVEAQSAAARRVLLAAVDEVGFQRKALAACRNHGFIPRASAEPPRAVAAPATVEDALAAIAACGDERVLWSAPDAAQLEHSLRDPRPRRLLRVEEAGRAVGAAAVFLSEIATAQGVDRVATVDALYLPEPTAARVAAVLRAASEAFSGQATLPVVSAPNLAIVPADQLRPAGARPTAATFDAYIVHPEGGPWMDAEVTNLEVV
ncbi:GNAT family N-acetyltransferase [Sorangium sp. So ce1097]|uniref:GNAT family N-acetyltransferase n=1 Tax=Sorangium sp. So ce1097 TaxID=3133330 RepID=UPI003F5D85A2